MPHLSGRAAGSGRRIPERAKYRIHSGLIACALAFEPLEHILIEPQRDQCLGWHWLQAPANNPSNNLLHLSRLADALRSVPREAGERRRVQSVLDSREVEIGFTFREFAEGNDADFIVGGGTAFIPPYTDAVSIAAGSEYERIDRLHQQSIAGRSPAAARQVRISANVTGDFGSVTDAEPMLCCAGKIV